MKTKTDIKNKVSILAFSPIDGHAFIQKGTTKVSIYFLKPPYDKDRQIVCTYPEMKCIISQSPFYVPETPHIFETVKDVISFLKEKTDAIRKELGVKITHVEKDDVLQFLNNLPEAMIVDEIRKVEKTWNKHKFISWEYNYLNDLYKTKQVTDNPKLQKRIEKMIA